MKKLVVMGMLLVTVFITGCYDGINRSQTEINLVAEYIADVLQDKALETDLRFEVTQEPTSGKVEEPTTGNTEEPTTGNTEEPTTGGNTELPTGGGNTEKPTQGGSITVDKDNIQGALGIDNVNIKVTNIVFTKQYFEEGGIISTEAGDGKTLIVIEMDVDNSSSQAVTFNTKDSKAVYKLVVNDTVKLLRLATGLNCELINNKDKVVPANGSIKCIMAFQIDDIAVDDITTIGLSCTVNNEEKVIKLR